MLAVVGPVIAATLGAVLVIPALAADQPQKAAAHWRVVFSHHYGAASHAAYYAVVASGSHEGWALGGIVGPGQASGPGKPIAARWHHGRWYAVRLPRGIGGLVQAASGVSADDVWAVSWGGYILHWDGSTWRVAKHLPSLRNSFAAITAFRSRDVWVLGIRGLGKSVLWHLHGGRWTKVTGVTDGIEQVSAVSAHSIWALATSASNQSVLLHYDGTTWREAGERMPRGYLATDVVAVGRGDVWVHAFRKGHFWMLHRHNARWVVMPVPANLPSMARLTGDSHGGLWALGTSSLAVGNSGTHWVLHLTQSGHWSKSLIGTNGAGMADLTRIPGTSAFLGAGTGANSKGADAAVWEYLPTR
jgi:hypothetical protein